MLHKDERDRFYKIHANAVELKLRSVYSTSLQRYYDDAYVYNSRFQPLNVLVLHCAVRIL